MINMSVHRKTDARTRFEDVLLMRCNLNYTIWDECGLYCWSWSHVNLQSSDGTMDDVGLVWNRAIATVICIVGIVLFCWCSKLETSCGKAHHWFRDGFFSLSLNSSHLFRNSKQYPIVFCAYAHRSQWLPHAAVSVYHPSVCVSAIYKVLHFVQCSLPFASHHIASHRIVCIGKH